MPHGGSNQPNRRLGGREQFGRSRRKKAIGIAILMAMAAAPCGPAVAQQQAVGYGETFEALAGRCAPTVHIRTMSAVVMQESKGYQFAIGINGRGRLPRQPLNEAEAIATARWLIQNGFNFDAGLGQINSANFRALGLTPETLFEPCTNLRSAAVILSQCYAKSLKSYGGQTALHGALSCYNTGNLRRGFANGYVRKVVSQVSLPVPALLGSAVPRAAPAPQRRAEREVEPAAERSDPIEMAAKAGRQLPAENGMADAFSRGPRDAFSPPPPPPAPLESDDGPVRLTVSAESF